MYFKNKYNNITLKLFNNAIIFISTSCYKSTAILLNINVIYCKTEAFLSPFLDDDKYSWKDLNSSTCTPPVFSQSKQIFTSHDNKMDVKKRDA